jgi:hypothetical protein
MIPKPTPKTKTITTDGVLREYAYFTPGTPTLVHVKIVDYDEFTRTHEADIKDHIFDFLDWAAHDRSKLI